jgi:hypothetical protein
MELDSFLVSLYVLVDDWLRERHPDRKDWAEEDLPLMKRLLGLVREVRAEEAAVRTGEFPWQAEMREEQRRGD